jgi:small-conductance mechanosensitive channel
VPISDLGVKMAKAPRENRIPIMMSHEELAGIDDWRFAYRVATRSEAIRRLCRIALAVQPIIMTDAMDQVEQLTDVISDVLRDYESLSADIRQGKFAATATGANVCSDAISDLSEIADQAYWLQLHLLEANNLMSHIANLPAQSAKTKTRKTKESIQEDRDDLLSKRRESFRNMLLIAVENAETAEQKAAYEEMSEDQQDEWLSSHIDALEKRLDEEMGLNFASPLYREARGEYAYDFDRMIEIASEVVRN